MDTEYFTVATITGVGTDYHIEGAETVPCGGWDGPIYQITVSSGPVTRRLIGTGYTWAAAMDWCRDRVRAEIRAEIRAEMA